MIVPMKKVSLIIKGDQKSETLRKLRKLGIIHIEAVEGSGKKLEELKERVSLLESALFSVSEKKNKKVKQENTDAEKAVSAAKEIIALEEEKKLCSAQKIALATELDRLSAWGELDPEKLAEISERFGLFIPHNYERNLFHRYYHNEYTSVSEDASLRAAILRFEIFERTTALTCWSAI